LRRAARFGYLNARVRGLRSKLLTPQDYDSLVRAKDVADAIRILSETTHLQPLAGIARREDLEIPNLENALAQSYYETFERVIKYADETTRPILDDFFEKHEAVCLKSLLRMIITRTPVEKSMDYIIPVGRFTPEMCRRAITTRDAREVAALASDEDLRDEILKKLPECEKSGSSLPIEASIEKYVFEKIWNSTIHLEGIDLKNTQRLVGTEIDADNMMMLVRAIHLGLNGEMTKGFLVPIRFRIGDLLDKALGSKNPFEAMRTLSRGAYHVDPVVVSESEASRSTLPWELALRKVIVHESSIMFLGYPLQVAIPLAFLNLKFFEIGDIRTILVGKKSGADPSKIASSLVAYRLR